MAEFTYKIRLQKEPEGGYTVTVPALPGCVTYGDDVDHAIEMAKENPEFEYVASAAIEVRPIKMKEEQTDFTYPNK